MLIRRFVSSTYNRISSISSDFISNNRLLSTKALQDEAFGQVRVRFAPSPTGHIHLGGLRAALYNFIFARQNDGKFVLRIEDTDQARTIPGSADEIEQVLNWAGIAPDESPRLGGQHGPYEQSKRQDIYKEYANHLLDSGKAYRCFCSPLRLELLRKQQSRNHEKTRYDGKCKHLTPDEVDRKLVEENGKHVVRFSLMEGDESFDDLVFGIISANLIEARESDPIIMKSDGYPTYHFASVVDDHLMSISHVLRGSEWISSTIKHVQLYKAFGWQPPRFVHLPLVTMHDGSKMSKRNDHSHVTAWIEAGYQPETLFNFLTNSGGGVPKWKQDQNEFWSLDELVKGFDFKQLTSHPGSLDINRLHIYSAKELQRTWALDKSAVMRRYKALMAQRKIRPDIEDQLAESIIGQLLDRLTSIDDLLSSDHAFIWLTPELTWSKEEYTKLGWKLDQLVSETMELIGSVSVENKEVLGRSLKELAQRNRVNYGEFMKFMRKLLTNSERGLPVHEICQFLGHARLMRYLGNGLAYVKS